MALISLLAITECGFINDWTWVEPVTSIVLAITMSHYSKFEARGKDRQHRETTAHGMPPNSQPSNPSTHDRLSTPAPKHTPTPTLNSLVLFLKDVYCHWLTLTTLLWNHHPGEPWLSHQRTHREEHHAAHPAQFRCCSEQSVSADGTRQLHAVSEIWPLFGLGRRKTSETHQSEKAVTFLHLQRIPGHEVGCRHLVLKRINFAPFGGEIINLPLRHSICEQMAASFKIKYVV